jgi:hypothetical protein
MTMVKMTLIKTEEKRLSATAMTSMIESTINILLDHKKEYFVKNKNSLIHHIRTKLSKQLKRTWKATQYQRSLQERVIKEDHRRDGIKP